MSCRKLLTCLPSRRACHKHRRQFAYSLILLCAARLLAGPETPCDTSQPAPDERGAKGEGMAEAGLMRGKRGLIMGVANNRSIAWGIAKAARQHGARSEEHTSELQ